MPTQVDTKQLQPSTSFAQAFHSEDSLGHGKC